MNKVMLIGNVGRDPEIRSTQQGTQIANFSIATSERWTDRSGEKQEKTEWHNIVVFNEHLVTKVVEPYIKKGSKLFLEGKIQTRKWEKDGVTHYSTEIVLSNFDGKIELLGDASGSRGGRAPPADSAEDYGQSRARPTEASRKTKDDLDDDIPF